MLVEKLALAYKCHNSIGNSIDLKVMIHEVLETFVSESYAIYSEFLLIKDDNQFEKIDSFGKVTFFESKKYINYKEASNLIIDEENNLKILKLNLENGIIFLVSKLLLDVDCSFFISMFESLIPKLNLSVNACLNFQKLEQTNELLKKQKDELIKANKTKDDFLANMSHELKTPLNSITVISSIMARNKDNKLDESQIKNMKIIKKCSEDLLILINDILDISKIEAGFLQIFKEDLNLKNLLNELYDSFEELALNKNIELKKEFNGTNFYLYSDEKRISQIVKNFLTNAIKFTNKGFVTIKLEEFDKYFQIDIIDSGIGIPAENLSNIFDRFKQVDDSRTRKYGGTGLGLAISKELSIMLHCNLEVESTVGVGSKFSLLIPKDFDEELNQNQYLINKSEKNGLKQGNLLKKEIFILYSNNIEQFKITIDLKKYGFKIHPFFDIDEFYLKIQNSDFKELVLIIDKKITKFDLIIEKCKEKSIDLIVIGKIDENSKNIYCIDENRDFNVLLEEIKNHLISLESKKEF